MEPSTGNGDVGWELGRGDMGSTASGEMYASAGNPGMICLTCCRFFGMLCTFRSHALMAQNFLPPQSLQMNTASSSPHMRQSVGPEAAGGETETGGVATTVGATGAATTGTAAGTGSATAGGTTATTAATGTA